METISLADSNFVCSFLHKKVGGAGEKCVFIDSGAIVLLCCLEHDNTRHESQKQDGSQEPTQSPGIASWPA